MPKFSVDLDNVKSVVSKRSYKLSDVQDKIVKIAFDVVRFQDAPADELWQIQNADDGDYIIALYDEEEKVATASLQPWSVVIKNSDLHVFYKEEHLCKVASTQLGFKESDLSLAKQYLPRKLASNKNLVKALLNSVDHDTQKSILSKYPELA
jgi:hypothetical protein